jgi:hypothetical protein
MKIFIWPALLLIFPTVLLSQVTLPADHAVRATGIGNKFISAEELELYQPNFTQVDTELYTFPIFDDRAWDNDVINLNIGNLGTASRSLLFQPDTTLGFKSGFNAFTPYQNDARTRDYYNTSSPYTELFYANGFKNKQWFEFNHNQNINPFLNVGIDYRKLRSNGTYQRLQTEHTGLDFYALYLSPSNRYQLATNYSFNNILNEENGGLKTADLFRAPSGLDAEFESVNLDAASNQLISRAFYAKQSLNFGEVEIVKTDSTLFKYTYPKYKLIHEVYASANQNIYRDNLPLSDFYPAVFFDSTRTYDDANYNLVENTVKFKKLDVFTTGRDSIEKTSLLGFEFGAKHQVIGFDQSQRIFKNNETVFALATVKLNLQKLTISAQTEQGVAGFYSKDQLVSAKAIYVVSPTASVSLQANERSVSPSLKSETYSGNHFNWMNDFEQQQFSEQIATLNLSKIKTQLSIKSAGYSNLIYYNVSGLPEQSANSINILSASVKNKFNLGNFHFSNFYQLQLENSDIVQVPQHYVREQIYYENRAFQVLKYNIGVAGAFFTGYTAMSYNPAYQEFYLGNTRQSGNYPMAYAYISGYIKRARLMVKAVNVAQGLDSDGYYMYTNQPSQNRFFQVDLTWRFFD